MGVDNVIGLMAKDENNERKRNDEQRLHMLPPLSCISTSSVIHRKPGFLSGLDTTQMT